MYGAARTGTAPAGNVVNAVVVKAAGVTPVSFQPTARGAATTAPLVLAPGMCGFGPFSVAYVMPVPVVTIIITSQYNPMSGNQVYWAAGLSWAPATFVTVSAPPKVNSWSWMSG